MTFVFAPPATAACPADAPVPAAFADCFRDHGGAVHAMAARICGATTAADVAQEVFLELWHHPDRFDPSRGSLRSYLVTMARHKAIDALRAESARRARQERAHRQDQASELHIDTDLLAAEAAADIAAALDALPARERDAIVTAFYGGCTYREAAVVLGESEGTVKSRIRAGLYRLRSSIPSPAVSAAFAQPVAT